MSTVRNPNSAQRLKRLKLRQRKKMRVGEFRELGFHLLANIKEGVETDPMLDEWLNRIDAAGVSFGGHFDGRNSLEGVVFPVGETEVTETLRQELVSWLEARAEVAKVEASELIDLWHAA